MNPARRRDLVGVLLLSLSGLAIVGLMAMRGCHGFAEESRDSFTGCPKAGATGVTVILIDTTDPFTSRQLVDLRRRVQGVVEQTRENSRVSLHFLGAFPEGYVRRAFYRCAPKRRANPLFENPQLVAARCDSLFDAPLSDALAELDSVGEIGESPIREAVQAMAGEIDNTGRESARLVVVSDLLERSSDLHLDRDIPSFNVAEHAPEASRKELGGVEAEIWLVSRFRDRHVDEGRLRAFWTAYFTAFGASSVRISRL